MLIDGTVKKSVLFSLTLTTASLAEATTINVNAPSTLYGRDAYTVGGQMNVQTGQQLSSMTISFDNVQLTSAPIGYLYLDLLTANSRGLSTFWDGDRSGDAFVYYLSSTHIVSLAVKHFNCWYQTLSCQHMSK